jgi:hypothetical protein
MNIAIILIIVIIALLGIGTIFFIVKRAKCAITSDNKCPDDTYPFCSSNDATLTCENAYIACGSMPEDFTVDKCSLRTCSYDPSSTSAYKWVCKPNAIPTINPKKLNPYNVTPVTDKTNEIKILLKDFFYVGAKSVDKVDEVTVTTGEDNSGINFNITGGVINKCYQITGTFYTPSDGDIIIQLINTQLLTDETVCNPTDSDVITVPGNNIKTTIILNFTLITVLPFIHLEFNKSNIYISDIRINPVTLPCSKCST